MSGTVLLNIDHISGGGGADTLIGTQRLDRPEVGPGHDTYGVTSGDVIFDSGGDGTTKKDLLPSFPGWARSW